jgi:hypothetical protein
MKMKRAIYIGKDEIYVSYGQTGWLDENEVFMPDGSKDRYIIPVNCFNFFFPDE